MRKVLLALILCMMFAHQARAQQVQVPCTQVPGTNGMPASCVPTSTTNPLPIYLPTGQ